MTPKQKETYNKFVKFTNWMCADIKRTMLCAKANFLVAMGLFNYTEILGGFIVGEHRRDQEDNVIYDRKGDPRVTSNAVRFNGFLCYMGHEYEKILNQELNVYDELRCGLTHEYLVKNKTFCIYNPSRPISDVAMERTIDPTTNKIAKCGIIHHRGSWYILNAKYYIDFSNAVKNLQAQIKQGGDKILTRNFFERAKIININNFA